MIDNNTNASNVSGFPGSGLYRPLTGRIVFVQVLAAVFFYVNLLMIFTFFKKEAFRSDTRYILFAQMLLADSAIMAVTDLAVLLIHFQFAIPIRSCIVFNLTMIWLQFLTPLTLVAMCLERYAAICMPLRYGAISTPSTRLVGLLLIWGLSSVPPLVVILAFTSVVPLGHYTVFCSVDVLNARPWQWHLQISVFQLYFLFMSVIIAFTYVRIMLVARAASGDNRKSTTKGLHTVLLHGFQLLLCLIQLWSPLVEMTLMEIDIVLYSNVRFFNFLMFMIAPRCLSPLIYGLRDKTFCLALKHYAVFGLKTNVLPI